MANALVLRSPATLSSPLPNHPRLPDIVSNLWIDLDPATISGVANNAAVTSITARGLGAVRDRTFDRTRTDAAMPLYLSAGGPSGVPCLSFDGTRLISNGGTIAGFPTPIKAAFTYAIVARVTGWPAVAGSLHNARLMTNASFSPADGLQSVQPTSTGQIGVVAGEGAVIGGDKYAYPLSGNPSGWFAGVVSFNGANGAADFGAGRISFAWDTTGAYRGLSLGGSQTIGLNSQPMLVGRIARAQVYRRGFTPDEVSALREVLADQYGLA